MTLSCDHPCYDCRMLERSLRVPVRWYCFDIDREFFVRRYSDAWFGDYDMVLGWICGCGNYVVGDDAGHVVHEWLPYCEFCRFNGRFD